MTTRHWPSKRLRPKGGDEYLPLHRPVWREVEERLRDSNIGNYSISLVGDLFPSYCEYGGEDLYADLPPIAEDPHPRRWCALTDPCQESLHLDSASRQWSVGREKCHLS